MVSPFFIKKESHKMKFIISLKITNSVLFLGPFHAAELHSKERLNDSAEYPTRGYKHP
jgi:hypothetical protein